MCQNKTSQRRYLHALQALVRGHLGRCEARRRLAERRALEAAAARVIAPWARTALERARFPVAQGAQCSLAAHS